MVEEEEIETFIDQDFVDVILLAGGDKDLSSDRLSRRHWGFRHWVLWLVTQLVLVGFKYLLGRDGWMPEDKPTLTRTKGWDIWVGGKRCVERIVTALRASSHIGTIVLAADLDPGIQFLGVDVVVSAGNTPGESLLNAEASVDPRRPTLVICADAPFLTVQVINRFILKCLQKRAYLFIGYVPKECSLAKYPKLSHTWGRFWDDRYRYYCASSLVLVHPLEIPKVALVLDRFYGQRKNILAIAWQIGLGDLLLYRFGRYTIDRLERRFSAIFDTSCVGICLDHPDDAAAAFNIDKKIHLEVAQEYCQLSD